MSSFLHFGFISELTLFVGVVGIAGLAGNSISGGTGESLEAMNMKLGLDSDAFGGLVALCYMFVLPSFAGIAWYDLYGMREFAIIVLIVTLVFLALVFTGVIKSYDDD